MKMIECDGILNLKERDVIFEKKSWNEVDWIVIEAETNAPTERKTWLSELFDTWMHVHGKQRKKRKKRMQETPEKNKVFLSVLIISYEKLF